MSKDKKILITGATGFIGRFLVQELINNGYKCLTVISRKTSNVEFLKNKNINIVNADISNKNSLDVLSGAWDIVFHCAGFVDNKNEEMLQSINICGTDNMCKFALERGVEKFIYVSSVAVNSANKDVPLTEDLPYGATNNYGVSKLEAEKIAIKFRDQGLPMVIVRPCMVYGEGEPHMMPLLAKIIKLKLFFIPNFSNVRWHIVSVRNVAACLVRCMEDDRALGQIFQIADKEVFTAREVLEIISKSLGVNPIILPGFLTRILMLMPYLGKRIKFFSKDRTYSIKRLEEVMDFIPPYKTISELKRAGESLSNQENYILFKIKLLTQKKTQKI